jgi:flagellar protein FliS
LKNPLNMYQAARVNGASPARLVLMLYDRLIGCLQEGRTALAEGRPGDAQAPLIRAQRIISELLSALDPGGGEVTANLHSLYVYCLATIEKAKTGHDPIMLDAPAQVLETLRGSWRDVAEKTERQGQALVEPSLLSAGGPA